MSDLFYPAGIISCNFVTKTMNEVNPRETSRAYAFEMWMKAPMPMVTFFKTLDVSRIRKISLKKGLKFNMLMCWCIGKAATQIKEFFLLPVGDKLIQYDSIAVNTIVANSQGEVSSCDIPFTPDLKAFNADYLRLTRQVAATCENHDLIDSMVIGTSALARFDIDGAVGAIPQRLVQDNPHSIIPIPPHPDGWRARRPLP